MQEPKGGFKYEQTETRLEEDEAEAMRRLAENMEAKRLFVGKPSFSFSPQV